jgi:hypothetical protein
MLNNKSILMTGEKIHLLTHYILNILSQYNLFNSYGATTLVSGELFIESAYAPKFNRKRV